MWSQKAFIGVFSYMFQSFFFLKDVSAYDGVETYVVIKNDRRNAEM